MARLRAWTNTGCVEQKEFYEIPPSVAPVGKFQMQKKQDHILWTLESKKIDHEQIDIGDPNHEKDREFMRENVNSSDKAKTVLPPQIFNDETYVGVSVEHRVSR